MKSLVALSGIYRIRNVLNGMIYIGSTTRFHKRWCGHKLDLRRGRHSSPRLQNAWTKYGSGIFAFEILLVCEVRDLLKYEQAFIDHYKSANRELGYNIN